MGQGQPEKRGGCEAEFDGEKKRIQGTNIGVKGEGEGVILVER